MSSVEQLVEEWVQKRDVSSLINYVNQDQLNVVMRGFDDREKAIWGLCTLAKSGDKKAFEALSKLLLKGGSSHMFAPTAASALSQLDKGGKMVLTTLKHDDLGVRSAAATALGASRHPKAFNVLIKLFKSSKPDNRDVAWHGLYRLGDARVIPHLLKKLTNKDKWVRAMAAGALYSYPQPEVMHKLIATLMKDKVAEVRAKAASALGHFCDPLVIPPLIHALKDPDEGVRKDAAEAFVKLLKDDEKNLRNDKRLLEPLIEVLEDRNLKESFIRYDAAEALGYLGDRRAEFPLRVALGYPNSKEKEAAEYALRRLGLPVVPLAKPNLQDIMAYPNLQDIIGGRKAITVKCSKCGNLLEELSDLPFIDAVPDMKQWFGNVCINCKRIYCNNCINVSGPTPCPNCGQPTEPAQLYHLRKIGVG